MFIRQLWHIPQHFDTSFQLLLPVKKFIRAKFVVFAFSEYNWKFHLFAVSRIKKTQGLEVDQITCDVENDDHFLMMMSATIMKMMTMRRANSVMVILMVTMIMITMMMITMMMMMMMKMMTLIMGWLSTVPAQVISGRSLEEWCSL